MKPKKGDAGYLKRQKQKQLIIMVVEFVLVAAIMATGYLTTGSKNNMLSIVAVLGCLPASKALVGVIALFPHNSIPEEQGTAIAEKTSCLTVAYDMVITSKEHVMPVPCVAIWDNTICGYVNKSKMPAEDTASYMKKVLLKNRFGTVSVKLFTDYNSFLKRAAEMNRTALEENKHTKEKEEKLKQLLLSLSM